LDNGREPLLLLLLQLAMGWEELLEALSSDKTKLQGMQKFHKLVLPSQVKEHTL